MIWTRTLIALVFLCLLSVVGMVWWLNGPHGLEEAGLREMAGHGK